SVSFLDVQDASSSIVGVRCFIGPSELICFGCYLPSAGSDFRDLDVWDLLSDEISGLGTLGDSRFVLVLGDFNASTAASSDGPDVPDLPLRVSSDSRGVDANGRLLLRLCSENDLRIFNGRVSGDAQGLSTFRLGSTGGLQLIDYVLGSPGLFAFADSLRVCPETIASDHMPVVLSLSFRQEWNRQVNAGRFRLGAREQQQLASFLSVHRDSLLDEIEDAPSVDAMGSAVSDVVEHRLEWFPPSRPRRRLARQPWYSAACVLAYRAYRAAWRAHRCRRSDVALAQSARNLRNRYYAVLRRARREFDRSYGDRMQALFTSDSRAFHRALFPKGQRASDGVDVAVWERYFADFFAERGLAGDDPEPRVSIQEDCLSHPSLVEPFTEFEVAAALGRLHVRTCGGADSWTPAFFKGQGLAEAWRPLLVAMFNRCLAERRVPRQWLLGVIRPIWKRRGSKGDPFRYRPIMLCTLWYKVFVYLLMERLAPLLDPIRHLSQAGFRRGCETTTWILVTWGLLYKARRSGALLILLSLDLEKAYDSVSHSRLWLHLRRLG
ncbi:reverse transcriptase domain-containing protein, partial [Parasphingorhabdus sp.]